MVLKHKPNTIYRHYLHLLRKRFPENRPKTPRNTEIRLDLGFFPVDICSVHLIHCKQLCSGFFSQIRPAWVGMAGQKLCGKDQYGRFARSDEYSPGVTVPGGKSGHALQVRE